MKKKSGKAGLGVHSGLTNKATSSANTGVKDQKDYPKVGESERRRETAATPASLGPRKA